MRVYGLGFQFTVDYANLWYNYCMKNDLVVS